MVDVRFNLVLGKGAGDAADLAATAEAAPAADRIDVDTETAGSVEKGGAARKEPAAA